jgi:LacI family transcriptional regulator
VDRDTEAQAEPVLVPASPPTIYDVARVAGVSPSTVSRALSRPGRISAETERKVRDAAERLRFRINPSARALPTGRTGTIAVLLADITNPVMFGVVRGAERAAAAAGYALVVAESQESGEAEGTTAERVLSGVDGIVFASTRLDADRLTELARTKPAVLINHADDAIPSVLPDVEGGVRALVAHLASLDHRRAAYVSGPEASWIDGERWRALQRQGRDHGVPFVRIPGAAPTVEGGAAALEAVLRSGAGAVVAYNDLMAIGLLRAATARGVAVPAALSIAGFDDIFGSELTNPPITTVAAPLEEAGHEAVRLLLARIRGERPPAPPAFPTRLLVRGSTGRALATG